MPLYVLIIIKVQTSKSGMNAIKKGRKRAARAITGMNNNELTVLWT